MSAEFQPRSQLERDRLFQLSLDMLCVAGFDGYFKQINPAWSRTLGWSQQELLAFSWRDLVHPEDRRISREAGIALFSGKPTVCFENRHKCKDGSYRWLSWNAYPVVEDQTIFAVVRDITEQKAAERAAAELELRLRESQKMEALGTLAGGIAHDFNNILATILGNTTLAIEDVGFGHPAFDRLRRIDTAGQRAGDLVRQILAFSSNFSPKLSAQPLRPLLEAALTTLRAERPAGVVFDCALSDEPLWALADSVHLQQVLIKLCGNAFLALQGRPGRVEVGLAPVLLDGAEPQRPGGLAPGSYARLWVADTGIGMDTATRTRIFEPFFTTRPVGQGTGLGLSAVHGIVASHNGAIVVDSAPAKGSRFDVYLPLTAAPQPAAAPAAARVPKPAAQQSAHVLYVDDDETVMVLMDALLRRAGYRVTCHSDPCVAVSAVRDMPQSFDLIITDFNMPVLTGLGLAADVASIRADLPIVFHSGHITEAVRAEAARLGVRSVVNKGGSFDELGAVVHRILEAH
jgi:PAS domain S-box-containing protein